MSENPTPEDIAAAEAAAAAEAQQQLADAEAKAKADDEAAAAKPAARAAKIADPDLLRDVAYLIHMEVGVRAAQAADLAERLQKSHKLKLREVAGGMHEAVMLGLSSQESPTERDALINWGNAARRYLNELAA